MKHLTSLHKIGEGLHKIGELLTDTGFCNYITIYNNAGLILSTPHINNVYIKPSLTYRLPNTTFSRCREK